MSDDFSMVPRDLAGRIEELEDVFEGEYGPLVGEVRSLPPRDQLPPCQLCGDTLQVSNVFVAESGVAIALRLACDNGANHEAGQGVTFIFELLTRELYPERRVAEDDERTVTLSVAEFSAALERAADGEPVEEIVAEYRESD